MKTVKVKLGERSYPIHIGEGIIKNIPSFLKIDLYNKPLFVITNKTIKSIHGKKLEKALKPLSKKVEFFQVPDSEKAKSFSIYVKAVRRLAKFAVKTKPVVFAFGGGVVGDLAGFVASAYRRGVPYVQIPTTLLSQVDSAIGGKVAIDIKEAKNIVGDFYQPKAVFCDLQFLKTLPERELRNGLSEVVKYGIIKDKTLFLFLEKNFKKILKRDSKALEYIISKCCGIKAKVVEKDEFDTKDIRAILNFGHTLGHALEAASKYSGQIMHGEAVAKGMVMANDIALKLGMIKKKDHERMRSLIRKISPKVKKKPLKKKAVLEALSYDKKFIHGFNRFILPKRIGFVKVVDRIPQELIEEVITKEISS